MKCDHPDNDVVIRIIPSAPHPYDFTINCICKKCGRTKLTDGENMKFMTIKEIKPPIAS